MSVNIFDISSYAFDKNRSATPKNLAPLIFENFSGHPYGISKKNAMMP